MAKLVTLVWWPHSGGRWLSRSILSNHRNIQSGVFVHPWIFNSSDDILANDITSQIHKARSLPELEYHLKALQQSTELGRISGLSKYYSMLEQWVNSLVSQKDVLIGESCLGSPTPKSIDLDSIYKSWGTMKTIHLVRDPRNNLGSFKSRYEMDGDTVKIAASWLSRNAEIRKFFENRSNLIQDYLLVRYEDILENTKMEILRICDFVDIEFDQSMLSSLDLAWGRNTKITTPKKDKEIIESITKNELLEYNYHV